MRNRTFRPETTAARLRSHVCSSGGGGLCCLSRRKDMDTAPPSVASFGRRPVPLLGGTSHWMGFAATLTSIASVAHSVHRPASTTFTRACNWREKHCKCPYKPHAPGLRSALGAWPCLGILLRTTVTRRMKGSSVFYGFKSFADKLHAQLPLNQKESSRLLTALTSSFRKQLDEAHPTRAPDESSSKSAFGSGSPVIKQNLHSSAALADNHLASMLANPLLAQRTAQTKAEKDYLAAKSALEKNAGKDPVKLLEEYQEVNRANVSIAYLCLLTFHNSIKDLPEEARKKARDSIQPGRRILLWLLRTRQHDTTRFAQNTHFQRLLFFSACKENLE